MLFLLLVDDTSIHEHDVLNDEALICFCESRIGVKACVNDLHTDDRTIIVIKQFMALI